MTFETWMAKVDAWLESKCGLGSLDIPDYGYHDAFDAGDSPSVAGKAALREAGFYGGMMF